MNPPPLEPKEEASASMHVRDPRNSITANAPESTHPSDSGFPPRGLTSEVPGPGWALDTIHGWKSFSPGPQCQE